MSPEHAQTIGLQALAWILGNDDLRSVFLGATGSDSDSLRAGVDDPAVLLSVLEFICLDDAWVVAFCDAHDLSYDMPLKAQMAFPGGGQVHWT